MTDKEIEDNVRLYINKTIHLSFATARDNKPWVCEVHFVNDSNLNLYFVSLASTRHCQEIALNPYVAGNIVKQHSLTESPNGVYFEGTAEKLENPSREEIESYCQALNRDTDELKKQLLEETGRRMYRIVVDNWALFGKFGGATNQKHTLAWNGGKK